MLSSIIVRIHWIDSLVAYVTHSNSNCFHEYRVYERMLSCFAILSCPYKETAKRDQKDDINGFISFLSIDQTHYQTVVITK